MAAMLRTIFAQQTKDDVEAQWDTVAGRGTVVVVERPASALEGVGMTRDQKIIRAKVAEPVSHLLRRAFSARSS